MLRRLAIAVIGVALSGFVAVSAAPQTPFSGPRLVPGLTITTEATQAPKVRLKHVSTVQTFEAQASDVRRITWSNDKLYLELGPGEYNSTTSSGKTSKDSFGRLFLTFVENGDMISFRIER